MCTYLMGNKVCEQVLGQKVCNQVLETRGMREHRVALAHMNGAVREHCLGLEMRQVSEMSKVNPGRLDGV